MIFFSCVVLDSVEDDRDVDFMQAAHHSLELGYRTAVLQIRRVQAVRGEEPELCCRKNQ